MAAPVSFSRWLARGLRSRHPLQPIRDFAFPELAFNFQCRAQFGKHALAAPTSQIRSWTKQNDASAFKLNFYGRPTARPIL
jgi:hypothetical protein